MTKRIFFSLLFLSFVSGTTQTVAAGLTQNPAGKPTLVMIHGMFVGSWCWEQYRTYFEQRGYRCVTPQLRYHDTSLAEPPPPGLAQVGILDYVADVEKELDRLGERPVIIGHSLGGLIAQILASRGRARAAVLIAPAVPWGINPLTKTVLKSAWLNRQRLWTWTEALKPSFPGAVYSSLHRLPPEEQQRVYQRFTYESPRAAAQVGLWYFDLSRATRVDESLVQCPVLTVVGGEDRLTPPAVVRKIHDKYRRVSTYWEVPHFGHFLIAEPGWEKVAAIIEGWISSIGREK
ncbi:MAG: alpha/beta hydrolase [Syntrophales bacterium]|nr:alpha/beta hydrolase [Syntrophales bacterium]